MSIKGLIEYTKRVATWQEATFQEIISSRNKHWKLQMPRRHGKSHLLRRLAEHYIATGRSVYTITYPRERVFDGIKVKSAGKFIADEEDVTNVVFLIEGIHKWDPHHEIISNGGMIVNAYTKDWTGDLFQPNREYRVLNNLLDNNL